MKPKIIVEGTVGAGKTTFINYISDRLCLEPIYELTDSKLIQILENFYIDPSKWGFQLQIYFLTKRFKQMKIGCEKGNVVMDRSIFCDHIFPSVLLKRGEMTKLEYDIYKELHSNLIEFSTPPELMIYLKCSTKTAIDRIKKRGRLWELSIDENYWEILNREYEDFFGQYSLSSLLIINTDSVDERFSNIVQIVEEIFREPEKVIYEYNGNVVNKRSVANA
jgi:deoxyadenosine/deoxycytidine kinase